MTVLEAAAIVSEHYDKAILTDDEFFEVTEALKFIIDEKKDPYYMVQLSGFYMANKDYGLAYKYAEMARQLDYLWGYSCVANIYYNGLIGKPDYKKAFEYYSYDYEKECRIEAGLHIAYMYKDGLYVEKKYKKYSDIIKELYPKVTREAMEYFKYQDAAIPEVYYELALILISEENQNKAVKLLQKAKEYLAKRMTYNLYEPYTKLMHLIVAKLYELSSPNNNDLDVYDLFYILSKPSEADILYNNIAHKVRSTRENEVLTIEFENKFYRSIEDLLSKAGIDGKYLCELYRSLSIVKH